MKSGSGGRVNRRFLRWLLGPGIFVFAVSFAGNGQKVSDVNGVRTIHNSRRPARLPGYTSELTLVEELTIGRGTDEQTQFMELQSVQADSDGRIYALDPKAYAVKVFDADGRFIRSFGKRGQGPGEFTAPGRVVLTPSGEVAVSDIDNRRICFFTREGELKRELSTASWNFLLFRVNARGDIFADVVSIKEPGTMSFELLKFGPVLSSPTVLASEPFPVLPNHVNPFRPRFLHGLTRNGGLAWAVSSRYEITVLDPDGKPRLKVYKEPEPNPLTNRDRKALLREEFGDKGPPAGVTMDFPSSFPPLYSLIVTDADQIIVRTNVRNAQGWIIHEVFDPEGRFVSRFSLGQEEYVMMVAEGKAYTMVSEDGDGIPLVKRYRLVWK